MDRNESSERTLDRIGTLNRCFEVETRLEMELLKHFRCQLLQHLMIENFFHRRMSFEGTTESNKKSSSFN